MCIYIVFWYLTSHLLKKKNPYLLDIFGVALKFVAPQSEARDLMASATFVEE